MTHTLILPCSLGLLAASSSKLAFLFSHIIAERFYVSRQYWRSVNLLLGLAFRRHPSARRPSSCIWEKTWKRRGGEEYLKTIPCPASFIEILCTALQIALNKTPPSSLPQVEIEAAELRSGIAYTARVRCKVSENEDSYRSQWSEWSQTTVFQRAGTKNVAFTLIHVFSWIHVQKGKIPSKMKLFKSELAAFSSRFHLYCLVIWGSILTPRLFIQYFCVDSSPRTAWKDPKYQNYAALVYSSELWHAAVFILELQAFFKVCYRFSVSSPWSVQPEEGKPYTLLASCLCCTDSIIFKYFWQSGDMTCPLADDC